MRVLLLAALVASSTALAYVIPSFSILRRMVERRDELALTGLRVSGTASFTGEAAREAAVALGGDGEREVSADATFWMKLPGRCRMEVVAVDGRRAAVASSHGKRRAEGEALPSVTEAVAQVCPLLAIRSAAEGEAREGIYRHLRALGVDDKQTSLGRFDGRVVYVIGKPDPAQPQFWVYKDSFLPARVLYRDREGRAWDVRLRNFGSPVAGDWFPRIVEVARGDESLLRFTALTADGRARVDDALF